MKKRFFSVLLIISILLSLITMPVYADTVLCSGTCGANLTWILYDSGELVISGTGAMTNWSASSDVPWYSNRSSINKVTINNGVTSIGDNAFGGCSLRRITIPDSVTIIGENSFSGCYNLTSITIPRNVTNIGKDALGGSLYNINVDTNNNYYSSKDGVLFNKNQTELIKYPLYKSGNDYSIPNSVIKIGEYAFRSCGRLTSIKMPNSVTSTS